MMNNDARELRKLNKQQERIQAGVQSIKKYVEKFDPVSQSIKQIQIRLDKLIQYIDAFDEVQTELLNCEEAADNIDEQLKFGDETCTLRANMEDLITKHTVIVNDNSIRASQTSSSDAIKLPTIQPPSFSGNLEDWPSFFDTFNALFHNNTSLTDVQRLHYLKSSVLGPASDIIKNFSITADNYKVAYDELIRHYENKGFTIQGHIRSLLQSPKVSIASAEELRKLHHHVASHVRALKALGQPVQYWDAWLVTLICGQLDASTAGEWQLRQDSKELPTYDQMESFLAKRVFAYEVGTGIPNKVSERSHRVKVQQFGSKVLFSQSTEAKTAKCPLCSATHKIYNCDVFKKMPVVDRNSTVSKLRLCFNCLNVGHQVKSCRYPGCPQCGKKHNSKLHDEKTPAQADTNDTNLQDQTTLYTVNASTPRIEKNLTVMLSTSIVHIYDKYGQVQACRAVFDSGSQLNFMTKRCISKLGLSHGPSNINIKGVDSMSSTLKQRVQAIVASRFNSQQFEINLYAVPVIVQSLPSQPIQYPISIPTHIEEQLADPQFHVPGPIDILLGAEVFYEVLGREKCVVSDHAMLFQTSFGWIVTGKLPIVSHQPEYQSLSLTGTSSLSLFTANRSQPAAEEQAERHFVSTVSRDTNGRFIVKLPLAQDPHVLGDSRQMAQRRFFNLEKRFAKEPGLAQKYKTFMAEYLSMDHMEVANPDHPGPVYYLPHHAVLKAESLTTKLRVVFDGSAVSKSGLSLNDILLKGPKTQPDIINILLRFRVHRIAVTADIEKMYRQIRVSSEDCDLQRICYRANPHDQLTEYKLKTITYGTRSASFLSTRCLAQIAHETTDMSIKRIISQDFYVDDLISGGDSIEVVNRIHYQLQHTLNKYGFPLRKWCSSSSQFVDHIPRDQSDTNFLINMIDNDTVATLGLLWQPATDNFLFSVENWCPPPRMTKRSLLSDINSVFDPIGLVSPVLIKGKIFIQQLWALKISWDDVLSEDLQNRWIKFYSSLQQLNQVAIPRRVIVEDISNIKLHVFSDASQEAYGACAYICSQTSSGSIEARLYMSKSRVAPMKSTTIPRLELNGALLAAELARDISEELKSLNIEIAPHGVFLWSDSAIVIAWIKSQCKFQPYVSNRIARIQDISDPDQWHHVPTSENPADIVSRGMDAAAISQSMLWWHGPQWLQQEPNSWPSSYQAPEELPEIRPIKLVLTTARQDDSWILNRYSKYMQLIRITALVCRFVSNCKHSISKHPEKHIVGFITLNELQLAERFWLLKSQSNAFHDELECLKAGKNVHRKSALTSLSPFIDDQGLIRVGGRLANAHMHYSKKHPIVLPSRATITKLIFRYEHCRLMHLGPQALLAHISIKYWPIRGRVVARKIVQQCVQCFRAKPRFSNPFMAPLPRVRVNAERVFAQTGLDYCGPVFVRSGRRKTSPTKSYVCVFVCMVTRAVHLELVLSLSSEDFLAALARFMSRRGQCSQLYSDNGTNFIGANRILQAQFKEYKKNKTINEYLSSRSIVWHFIPPSGPHFGGLWEAAVQSAKRHLLRVTKGVLLTYDETSTLLCKIEAALNSRPMTPMSSDPSDFSVLTPGHFLIGEPLMLPPESDKSNVPMNRLRRFQLMQANMQLFWKRWSLEYLPQLQRRGKWTKITRNAVIGDLAILKEENLPPMNWSLVRVVQTHPGADGVVRAVTIRNSRGLQFKRPVVKLALLPTEEDENSIITESQPST